VIVAQYTIKLPADYDMEIIRKRVRDNGARMDGWPSLRLKAFLITEGAANRYAPFYLWDDAAGFNDFVYGAGFDGIVTSFGRPPIEHWVGLGTRFGDTGSPPRSFTREDRLIGEGEDLSALREAGRAWLDEQSHDDLYAAVVAVDPSRWQLTRCTLSHAPHAAGGYEVLYLARGEDVGAPGLQPDLQLGT
jgi:hypothetical protein